MRRVPTLLVAFMLLQLTARAAPLEWKEVASFPNEDFTHNLEALGDWVVVMGLKLHVSRDGGDTWASLDDGLGALPNGIDFHPMDAARAGDTLLAISPMGQLFASDGAQAAWRSLGRVPGTTERRPPSSTGSFGGGLWAQVGSTLRLTRDGKKWTTLTLPPKGSVESVVEAKGEVIATDGTSFLRAVGPRMVKIAIPGGKDCSGKAVIYQERASIACANGIYALDTMGADASVDALPYEDGARDVSAPARLRRTTVSLKRDQPRAAKRYVLLGGGHLVAVPDKESFPADVEIGGDFAFSQIGSHVFRLDLRAAKRPTLTLPALGVSLAGTQDWEAVSGEVKGQHVEGLERSAQERADFPHVLMMPLLPTWARSCEGYFGRHTVPTQARPAWIPETFAGKVVSLHDGKLDQLAACVETPAGVLTVTLEYAAGHADSDADVKQTLQALLEAVRLRPPPAAPAVARSTPSASGASGASPSARITAALAGQSHDPTVNGPIFARLCDEGVREACDAAENYFLYHRRTGVDWESAVRASAQGCKLAGGRCKALAGTVEQLLATHVQACASMPSHVGCYLGAAMYLAMGKLTEARPLAERACGAGQLNGCTLLPLIPGTPAQTNPKERRKLLEKACAGVVDSSRPGSGSREACDALEHDFRAGDHGIAADPKRADAYRAATCQRFGDFWADSPGYFGCWPY